MPNLTLSITEETKRRMQKHPSIKWSNAVRTLIEKKLADFEEADRLAGSGRLTMGSLKPILARVDAAAAKHAKALLNEGNC